MFCFYNQVIYLAISGSLRLASILRLSEEAGIQRLGSDSDAIWKVRLFSSTIASVISLVLAGNKSTFQMLFDPEALPGSVRQLHSSPIFRLGHYGMIHLVSNWHFIVLLVLDLYCIESGIVSYRLMTCYSIVSFCLMSLYLVGHYV